jgi:hypothetical protein
MLNVLEGVTARTENTKLKSSNLETCGYSSFGLSFRFFVIKDTRPLAFPWGPPLILHVPRGPNDTGPIFIKYFLPNLAISSVKKKNVSYFLLL